MHVQKVDEESIIRCEQEQQQKRTTRRRKKNDVDHDHLLAHSKQLYESKRISISTYQKKIRKLSYLYIDALNTTNTDTDDD